MTEKEEYVKKHGYPFWMFIMDCMDASDENGVTNITINGKEVPIKITGSLA